MNDEDFCFHDHRYYYYYSLGRRIQMDHGVTHSIHLLKRTYGAWCEDLRLPGLDA
jgi:hypothetical protein